MKNVTEQFVVAGETMTQLNSRLDWVTLQPTTILDMGYLTGKAGDLLKKRYPAADIITVEGSLLAEQPEYTVDLIFANLVLPWCADLQSVFKEWRRVLKPNGLLVFATLGPDTLRELKETRSLQLIDMHHVGDELIQAGFLEPVLDADFVTLAYSSATQMVKELQSANLLASDYRYDSSTMEKNAEQRLPVTFEIIYGQAWNAPIKKEFAADQEGIVKIPIESLRNG